MPADTLSPEALGLWIDEHCADMAMPPDPVAEFADAAKGAWRNQAAVTPRTVYYFYRLAHDYRILAMCFVNSSEDAGVLVQTDAPDRTLQQWEARPEGDLVVCYAPDGYAGGGVGVFCRWPLKPLPRALLEKEAVRNRSSGYLLMSSPGE